MKVTKTKLNKKAPRKGLLAEAKDFLLALFVRRAKKPIARMDMQLLDIKEFSTGGAAVNCKIEGYGQHNHIVALLTSFLENPEMKPLVMEAMTNVMGKQLEQMRKLGIDLSPKPRRKGKVDEEAKFN